MQESFSDPRILEYMEDGGEKYNEELKNFLLGIAILANTLYGKVTFTQQAILFNLNKGMSLHEAAVEEYDFLRKSLMG